MRTFVSMTSTVLVTLSLVMPALALAGTCDDLSASKKLAGAAKTSFLKKCEREAAGSCEVAAADKKLAGAAKSSFMKKCLRESGPGMACESKAAEKKLAGAAKNSFLAKCLKDAGAQ